MKMKILLISILKNSHRNLSILSLFATLNENDLDVKVLFLPKENEFNPDLVNKFVLDHKFKVIGISVMTDGLDFAVQITQNTKSHLPKSLVIWGGIHPTLMPEECLDYCDCVCVGEGEQALLSLVKKLENGESISEIPGIRMKLPDGGISSNLPAALVTMLDTLPFVKYDWNNFYVQDALGLRRFDLTEYTRYSNYNGEDYTLMATRSCPFNCSYCCNSYLNKLHETKGRVRKRSVDHVILELKYALKTNGKIQFINFIDDQFLTSKPWTEEFISKYQAEIGLPFIVRLVPDTVDEVTIKQLVDAGLRVVQIGLQSGSDKTHREIFHRQFHQDKLIESSRIFSKNGVLPIYDVIIQNDLETDVDRNETIKLLLKLQKPFRLTLFALTPYPHTELVEIYQQKGISPRTNPYGKGYSDLDENDFYFQLSNIIPIAPHFLSALIFNHKDQKVWRDLLRTYYNFHKRNKSPIRTAQKSK